MILDYVAAKQQIHKDVLTFLPRRGRFKSIQQGRVADNAALDAGHDRLEDVQSLPGSSTHAEAFGQVNKHETWTNVQTTSNNQGKRTNRIHQPKRACRQKDTKHQPTMSVNEHNAESVNENTKTQYL